MEESFSRLSSQVANLGRHYERYLITIKQNIGRLVERLEQHSMLDDVELWDCASAIDEQMRAVGAIGQGQPEQLDLLATYYSLQFLQMNLLALDHLELTLSEVESGPATLRNFIESQGVSYQRLNAAYIDCLLAIYLAGEPHPDFCICVVGTRSDQDDVDIMVIHDGGEGIDNLNRALGRLTAEFFRRAGRLHLYVAERMAIAGYAHTVAQYRAALTRDMTDFVMICELLSAEPLVGNWEILDRFRRQVTDRFSGRRKRWSRYYIGFLRGLLGEMHALLVQEISRERIDFKNDALRLIKGMTLAGKVVKGVKEVQPIRALERLASGLPALGEEMEELLEAYLFIEAFRLLYHMLGVEEEAVKLDDESAPTLIRVAAVMGFAEKGGVSAEDQLVVHYFESVERARTVCRKLMQLLMEKVREVSAYSWLAESEQDKGGGNIALELADSVRVFAGHIFFEDVLVALEERDGALASRLVGDLLALRNSRRARVISSFLEFADSDPLTLLSLMLIIRAVPGGEGRQLFDTMVAGFLGRMDRSEEVLAGLLSVYGTQPAVLNRFIEALSPSQRQAFEQRLAVEFWDGEQAEALERLRKYIWLRTAGSEYYRRLFRRVINSFPKFIRHLGDVERLRRYASGFLAAPESGFDPEQMRAALAHYYDVAYLACAIEALNGAPIERYRSAFIDFADKYISNLYAFCRKTVVRQTGTRVETRDLFAIFSSGGFARGQAFDDDYDLILILNSDDPAIFSFFRRLSSLMHRELVTRGTLPQYRFSDHFGEFVTPFSQLVRWFADGRADTVDKTQLLGSRMLAGSSRFLRRLQEELLEPYILADFPAFAREMADEILQRHQAAADLPDELVSIKEGAGGLRDIEQALLLLKARHRLWQPISGRLFDDLSQLEPRWADSFRQLYEDHAFLRRTRDLYRLSVAADDELAVQELAIVAAIMGLGNGPPAAQELADQLRARMERIAGLIARLVDYLCEPGQQ